MQKQLETVQGQQHGAHREFSLAGMVQVLLSGTLVPCGLGYLTLLSATWLIRDSAGLL